MRWVLILGLLWGASAGAAGPNCKIANDNSRICHPSVGIAELRQTDWCKDGRLGLPRSLKKLAGNRGTDAKPIPTLLEGWKVWSCIPATQNKEREADKDIPPAAESKDPKCEKISDVRSFPISKDGDCVVCLGTAACTNVKGNKNRETYDVFCLRENGGKCPDNAESTTDCAKQELAAQRLAEVIRKNPVKYRGTENERGTGAK